MTSVQKNRKHPPIIRTTPTRFCPSLGTVLHTCLSTATLAAGPPGCGGTSGRRSDNRRNSSGTAANATLSWRSRRPVGCAAWPTRSRRRPPRPLRCRSICSAQTKLLRMCVRVVDRTARHPLDLLASEFLRVAKMLHEIFEKIDVGIYVSTNRI